MEDFEGHIKVASYLSNSNTFAHLCGLAKTEV